MQRIIAISLFLINFGCSAQLVPTSARNQKAGNVWDVLSFGAACDWNGSKGTDDTAAFEAAATAAGATYAKLGVIQTVKFSGDCVLGGTVRYGSGVQWVGHGAIYVPKQNGPTLNALNADNVAWTNVNINILTSGTDSPYNAAILWSSSREDSSAHMKVAVHNCHITGSAWGITILYLSGNGSLSNVEISGNVVNSREIYTNWDGIHVAGSVGEISIHDNYILNRGDAGIALSSELQEGKHYVLRGAKVKNNILLEDLVGLDDSGATNAEWENNYVKATTGRAGAQNPAFRQIYYGDTYPTDVKVAKNYLHSGNNSGATVVAKIDPIIYGQTSWPALNSTFENNVIDGPNAPLYIRGAGITVADNTFLSGGQLTIDYDGRDNVATSDLVIVKNSWMREGRVVGGLGCALYRNIQFSPKEVRGPVTFSNLSCLGIRDSTAVDRLSNNQRVKDIPAIPIPCIKSTGPPIVIGRCLPGA